MNRRDLLLNEMNISQWTLTKPQVLKGDGKICLPTDIQLVVICDEMHQQTGLFKDILHALNLSPDEYQWFTLEQAMRLSFAQAPIFWLIAPPEQADRFAKNFANLPAWKHSSWQVLATPSQKRQLWQQIQPFCQHINEE